MKIKPFYKNPVTEDQIKRFEDLIGYKLPKNYIDFLHRNNGVDSFIGENGEEIYLEDFVIKPNNIDQYDPELLKIDDLVRMASYMYGFQSDNESEREETDDQYDLFEVYEVFKGRMPDYIIPIGQDPGGNQYVLNVEDGTIGFWDHEMSDVEDGEEPNIDTILYLVDSIDEFFDKLEPYHE